MADHLVLVGLMGSGKTTVGQEVASRTGRRFVDSDEQIEAATGRTVREIWTSDGEPAYRRLETAAMASALADPEPAVVAAAGGVVLDPANRRMLQQNGTVVWLDGDPAVLAERATTGDHRPLLDVDPAAAMRSMAEARRPLYEEVATQRVDVTELAPDAVVERVLSLLAGRASGATSP